VATSRLRRFRRVQLRGEKKAAVTKTSTDNSDGAPAGKGTAGKSGSRGAAGGNSGSAKGAPDDYPFDDEFLEQQRQLLLAERARYVKHAESLKAEADSLAADREPGDVQFDDESGEGDSIAVERERDLAMSAQARAAVEEIDAALQRIEDRTYGICTASGLPIPRERLEAIPQATMRVEYKSRGTTWN